MNTMKKLFSIIAISAVTFTACTRNPQSAVDNSKVASYSDTAGLAEYQNWKMQNELAEYQEYQAFKNGAMATAAVASAPAAKSAVRRTSSSGTRTTSSSGSRSTTTSNEAKAPAKKGWSKAAKGAAIGAAAGAIGGAVINKKNRAAGAVIGGVAGGAVGYGIGRHMDKKDGRY